MSLKNLSSDRKHSILKKCKALIFRDEVTKQEASGNDTHRVPALQASHALYFSAYDKIKSQLVIPNNLEDNNHQGAHPSEVFEHYLSLKDRALSE